MEVSVNSQQWDQWVQRLARELNISLPEITKNEASSVLKIIASHQWKKSAKAAKIRADVRRWAMQSIEANGFYIYSNQKKSAIVWASVGDKQSWRILGSHHLRKNLNLYKDGWHFSDKHWKAFNRLWKTEAKKTRQKIKTALESRGLGARSWGEAVKLLGRNPESISPTSANLGTSLTATTRTGKTPPRMVWISENETKGAYSLTVTNRSRIAAKNKKLVEISLKQRAGLYRRNFSEQSMETIRSFSRNYPGVKVF